MSGKYPWDKWFKRRRFTLVRHWDYPGQPHAMSAQVRNAACRRGLLVSVRIDEETLTITVKGER